LAILLCDSGPLIILDGVGDASNAQSLRLAPLGAGVSRLALELKLYKTFG